MDAAALTPTIIPLVNSSLGTDSAHPNCYIIPSKASLPNRHSVSELLHLGIRSQRHCLFERHQKHRLPLQCENLQIRLRLNVSLQKHSERLLLLSESQLWGGYGGKLTSNKNALCKLAQNKYGEKMARLPRWRLRHPTNFFSFIHAQLYITVFDSTWL